MVADLRMYTDFEESDGEVPIFDMAGYTLRHLTKINLSILRKYMAYTQVINYYIKLLLYIIVEHVNRKHIRSVCAKSTSSTFRHFWISA